MLAIRRVAGVARKLLARPAVKAGWVLCRSVISDLCAAVLAVLEMVLLSCQGESAGGGGERGGLRRDTPRGGCFMS